MLSILQVSTGDILGGAEKIAWNLFQAYRQRGHRSWLTVRYKHSDDHGVSLLPNDSYRSWWAQPCLTAGHLFTPLVGKIRGAGRMRSFLQCLGEPRRRRNVLLGQEDFEFPGTGHLLELAPGPLDILHCHNLHGEYFDLRMLPWLSRQVPTVLTLHDAWLLSGHCAHSFDCERWKIGCGQCPDLTIYPAVRRDATAYNWTRKRAIYGQTRLWVATPSRWLMQKVEQSMLASAVIEARVIPNGVDLSIFHPGEKRAVRAALDIPQDAKVVLFTGNRIRQNPWKDDRTVRMAIAQVGERLHGKNVLFVALGEESSQSDRVGRAEVRCIRYQTDPHVVACYYQTSDVYVHAARADTFPNSILEALACGIPVVATAVGGIPEQVEDSRTGFLVPGGDAAALALRLTQVLSDDTLRVGMGRQAADVARDRFDLRQQVDAYLHWYQEIVSRRVLEVPV